MSTSKAILLLAGVANRNGYEFCIRRPFGSKGAAVNEHVYCLDINDHGCPSTYSYPIIVFFFNFTEGLSVVLFFFLLRFDLAFFSREILCIVRDKYAFSIQIHAHRIVFFFPFFS